MISMENNVFNNFSDLIVINNVSYRPEDVADQNEIDLEGEEI